MSRILEGRVTDFGGKCHGYLMEMSRILESRICKGNEWFWLTGEGFGLLGQLNFYGEVG